MGEKKKGERRKEKEIKNWSEAEIDRRRMETEGNGQMEGTSCNSHLPLFLSIRVLAYLTLCNQLGPPSCLGVGGGQAGGWAMTVGGGFLSHF